MSAYIKSLREEVANESVGQNQPSDILKRLEIWHRSLPPVARTRPYGMSELESALKVPGRLLSTALTKAGWTRKRRWGGAIHYYRYWVPPKV